MDETENNSIPLVSVVVPVYMVEDLLRRCVDSILSQSHANLQIILIDDGSPDSSGSICDAYAAQDPRILVIHQPNGGLSAARNAGLQMATGEYVTFVDSDDWIHQDLVATLLRLSLEHQAAISVGGFCQTSGAPSVNDTAKQSKSSAKSTLPEVRELTNRQALRELMGSNYVNMVVSWGKLYRRNLFEEVNFPEGKYHEDEFVAHHLLERADRVVVTEEPLYYYWQREGSITATYRPSLRKDARDALLERAQFLVSKHMDDLASIAYRQALREIVQDRSRLTELKAFHDRDVLDQDLRRAVRDMRGVSQPLKVRVYAELHGARSAASAIAGHFRRGA